MASLKGVKVGDALVIETKEGGRRALLEVEEVTARRVRCCVWKFNVTSGEGVGEDAGWFARLATPSEIEQEKQRQEVIELAGFITASSSRIFALSLPTLREIKRLIDAERKE